MYYWIIATHLILREHVISIIHIVIVLRKKVVGILISHT